MKVPRAALKASVAGVRSPTIATGATRVIDVAAEEAESTEAAAA